MKLIHIYISIFICFSVIGSCCAGEGTSSSSLSYSIVAMEYPYEGYITASASIYGGYGGADISSTQYNTFGNHVNYSYIYSTGAGGGNNIKAGGAYTDSGYDSADRVCYLRVTTPTPESCESESNFYTTANKGTGVHCGATSPGSTGASYIYIDITLTIHTSVLYNISGVTNCVGSVALITDGTTLYNTSLSGADSYLFENLISGFDYTLEFSDGHQYNFICPDSNITYNYDGCSHTHYKLKESCGNLIPDSEGIYLEYVNWWLMEDFFYVPSGILDIVNSSGTKIQVHTDTFIGRTGWLIDPVITDTIYTLESPNINWGLKVIVQNESNGELIDGAMVKVDQTCYCTSGYSTRQKLTTSGMATFTDMSLQDASLFVMASGYKIIDENNTGYNVFLSGRTNFSSKTWVVKLAPSTSDNTSEWYEVNNKVDIYFRDINGNRTSQILDTDSEVYLYYENNNTDNEAMTLKFQSSSTHTHFIDVDSWNILYDGIGHKTILQADFTPWDYSYRAIIYNSSIYGWNITIPLTVRNATKESTQHYENLSTHLYFRKASDGHIDYREDMEIVIHACSNNITLLTVDVELYKNNSLLCYKNLTATDLINADFPYWYTWCPIYDYESGANYSIRMYGFDRTLLKTDYVECYTDTITRKNKLTINVKNHLGANLINSYVYLESYGSIATGSASYAAFEGLNNGYYRFKATKSGYDSSGWSDVTITDADEIVSYTLIESSSDASASAPLKTADDELKNLYLTLMFFMFAFILFGGFLYVSK